MKGLFYRITTTAWRLLSGAFQWHLLWFINDKFMVCVAGVVTGADGGILLVRHRYWTAGEWGLPGGIIKKRETVEAALQREVKEETGFEIAPERVLEIRSGYKLRLEVFVKARITGGRERLDEREVLEAGFFTREALPEGLLETHARVIDRAGQ